MKGFTTLLAASYAVLSVYAATVSTVYQWPNVGSWAENLAVRPNGQVLVTRIDVPEVWNVNPATKSAYKVYSFPNATSTSGMTQIGPDVYAVAAANVTAARTVVPGSSVVWKLDVSQAEAKASTIARITEAGLLNGLTTYSKQAGTILIADSVKGVVYELNVNTGAYFVALADPALQPAGYVPFGVNGVKSLGSYVYYTNTAQKVFGRVPFSGTAATGPYETLNSGYPLDDFVLRPGGGAYLCANPLNEILADSASYQITVLAGNPNSTQLAGVTAAEFSNDYKTLYATTSGGQSAPINGTIVVPATLVAIQLDWEDWN